MSTELSEKPQKAQKIHRKHRNFLCAYAFLCISALFLGVLGALGRPWRSHSPIDADIYTD